MAKLTTDLSPLLTEIVILNLNHIGVKSVVDFVNEDPEHLTSESGVPYKDILSLRRIFLAQFSASVLQGRDVYEDMVQSVAILPTGCESLDNLMEGGLYTKEMTELVGSAASGKTQICLQIALYTAKERHHKVIYIDTSGNFDIIRLHGMLETHARNYEDMTKILSKIHCMRAFDVSEVLQKIGEIRSQLDQEEKEVSCIKLVILDSIAAVISPVLGSHSTEGHAAMLQIASELKCIAAEFSLSVLLTNNTVSGEGGAVKPALGKTWLQVPHTRIQLHRHTPVHITPHGGIGLELGAGDRHTNTWTAQLVKSTRQKTGREINFRISDQGVNSVT